MCSQFADHVVSDWTEVDLGESIIQIDDRYEDLFTLAERSSEVSEFALTIRQIIGRVSQGIERQIEESNALSS